MRISRLTLIALAISCWAAVARAQSGANITLQLPSFHSFGVNTSVLVPDGGRAQLASQRQAFYERTMYGGLPTQRTLGIARGTSAVQVTAQIHDPRAAEAELIREARERRATWTRGSVEPHGLPQRVANDQAALRSLADIERQRAAQAAARAREAQQFLMQARKSYNAGKPGVAAVYYGMAANRSDAEQKQAIEDEARRAKAAASEADQTAGATP